MSDKEMIEALDQIIVAVKSMTTDLLEKDNFIATLSSYYDNAVTLLDRVSELHQPDGEGHCKTCLSGAQYGAVTYEPYPCATAKALSGETNDTN